MIERGDEALGTHRASRSFWRRAAIPVAVTIGYLVLACVAYWPGLGHLSSLPISGGADFTEAAWFLGWTPHALLAGHNPFWTDALNAPYGTNLADNTTAPLLGLLSAPISLAVNPLAAANVVLFLAMPLSAASACAVLRQWRVWWPAAALGGLFYGFSPYMVGQSLIHPTLAFVPIPPLLAGVIVSLLRRPERPIRRGVALGALVAAQFLISPEIAAIVLLFGVLGVALFCVAERDHFGELLRTLAPGALVALGVAGVVLAYPIWFMIDGPMHFHGTTFPLRNPFHNDLLATVVPGRMQRLTFGAHGLVSTVAGGSNLVEDGGYLGLPLLVIAGVVAWRSRASSRMRYAVVLAGVALVLGLGPTLVVAGHDTGVPLPFALIGHIPLLGNILPERLNLAVALFVAGIVAFGLDDLERAATTARGSSGALRRWRAPGAVAVTLVVMLVTLAPLWPIRDNRVLKSSSLALPSPVSAAIPTGNPIVLSFPYAVGSDARPMLWQLLDQYRFRLSGGYVYIPSAAGTPILHPRLVQPPGLQELLASAQEMTLFGSAPAQSPELDAQIRAALDTMKINVVLVSDREDRTGRVRRAFASSLGAPTLQADGYTVWDLPPRA